MAMTRTAQWKLISIIAIFAGPALAYWGYHAKVSLAELEKNGITVPGIIDGGESKTGRNSHQNFDVHYTQQGGVKVNRTFGVKRDYFKAHTSENTISDPNVQVRYLPSDPSNVMLIGGSTDNTAMLPVGIGTCIGGILVFGFMRMRGL